MTLEEALALVGRIYDRLNARRDEIHTAEDYYDGAQPLTFATQEWKRANAARYKDFSDNWCGTVINSEAERLRWIGLTGIDDAGAKGIWDTLQVNEFDAQFSAGVVTALTARRAYVMVWSDSDGEPLVTFEHPAYVEIEYDWENPRLRKAALKTWVDDKREYATLYTADQIWKFQRDRQSQANSADSQAEQGRTMYGSNGHWAAREVSREVWPLPNPLGVVPVVEIANRPTLKGDPVSEIAGVIPMQNAINLLWAYLFLSADYASMPARVLLGTTPPVVPVLDSEGNKVGTRPLEMRELQEKRLAVFSGADAKIDQWDPARLDVFTDVIEIAVGHIAAQTRTPPHYLVANKGLQNLSGDALKNAEAGLVTKVKEFQTFTDPALREVARLIALVRGEKELAQQARLAKIVWQNPEIRSDSQLSDALLKKRQIGYPFAYILEQDGKSPDDIARILTLREVEIRAGMSPGAPAEA